MMPTRATLPQYRATERYVLKMLHLFGQDRDANDPKLVGRIVSELLRVMPETVQDVRTGMERENTDGSW